MTSDTEIAIVGAGLSGLALAAALKAEGRDVTILEAGVPPLKWSTNWDSFIPFSGGPSDGWKARQTRRDRAEAAAG